MEALIFGGREQKAHEFRVGLYGNEDRVRAHTPEDFRGDAANAGAVFHYHTRLTPVDGLQQLLDQEPRARNDRTEHAGMTEKIAREKQSVAVARPTGVLLFVRHGMSPARATHFSAHYASGPARVAQELKLRTFVLPLVDHGLDTARGAKDSRRLWPRIPGAWRKLLKQQKVTAIRREVTAIGRAGACFGDSIDSCLADQPVTGGWLLGRDAYRERG